MSVHQLEFLNTAMRGKIIPVKDGWMIGSGPDCRIRAVHPELKAAHARFAIAEQAIAIELVDQTARLEVNGGPVIKAELKHHDEITVGPLRLRVLHEGIKPVSASPVSRSPAGPVPPQRPVGPRASGVINLDQLLSESATGFEDGAEEIFDFAKEDLFYRSGKEPQLRKRIAFVIPSRDKFIDQAQVFITRLAKNSGADEMQVDGFMTCAKELILNAHRHGHKYDESRKIIVRYRDDGQCLSLCIEDEGPGFDHRKVIGGATAKDAASAARERYQAGGFGGLGFQLITRLSKTLVYNDAGNVVTFTVAKTGEAE